MKRFPVAFLDACVLVPMPLADTLLRLAEPPELFQPQWSDEILAEVTRTLIRRFAKTPEKARYREAAMRAFFPSALVKGYEPLVSRMKNHPKDRHVLAAAVKSNADYLVTFNLKDFPRTAMRGLQVNVAGPSAFLKELWNHDRLVFEEKLNEQAKAIGVSLETLLTKLAASVPGFAAALS